MKSTIIDVAVEPGITDREWQRLTLDRGEMVDALRCDRIKEFVARALASYSDSTMFPLVVDDVLQTVLNAMADKLSQALTNDLIVLFEKSLVDRMEAMRLEARARYKAHSSGVYWMGEAPKQP